MMANEQNSESDETYHSSLCGSLLHSTPSQSPAVIFSYLQHGDFHGFRQSFAVHYKEIIQMRNERGQTVLHLLTIHNYSYAWIRLLLMRGCDICAQDSDGYTAAHYAVERDDLELLKALTVRFSDQMRFFSKSYIDQIHQQALQALTMRTRDGLTAFMLACRYQSIKCLRYLLELTINDTHLEDHFGDTCLHYAVAHRNRILIEILINQCQANVNGGDINRPSVLDVFQFTRERDKPEGRMKDADIEQLLLLHHAQHRGQIRRTLQKHHGTTWNESNRFRMNLVCLPGQISSLKNQLKQAQN